MTKTKAAAWFLVASAAAACGGQTERQDTSSSTTTEHAARFVGDWDITFTTNRDSSAVFTLAVSGAIEVGRHGTGTPLEAIAEKPGAAVLCGVGGRWHSAGPSTLVLDGVCSDGVARDVWIAFPMDASSNGTSDLHVAVVSVGAEGGWRATELNGPWQLRRCPSPGCGR
jgi:hypothetical protein